jgi:hypothetical protein
MERKESVAMNATYRAVLRGNRLEWRDEEPQTPSDRGVEVVVTILEHSNSLADAVARGAAMARPLERLAAAGGLQGIGDAAEWQRELRQERSLPGRDS